MADIKWIKLDVGFPDNRKIKRIRKLPDGDKIILFWVFLLARAGETNQSGALFFTANVPYTEEDFAADFDFEIDLVRLALATLERFKMIERYDDIIFIKNWDEYQELDKLEKINEKNRLRQAKYRKKQQLLAKSNVTVTLPVTQSNAVEQELELKQELDKELDKEQDHYSADAEIIPDGDFAELYQSFESELGRPLSVIESDQIIDWRKDHSDDLITEALKRSVLRNVKNMQYINGILQNWDKSGLKCLNDVLEADKHRERNKKAAGVSGKATSNRSFRNGQEDIYSDEIYEVF